MARTGLNTNEVVASIIIERIFGFLCALFPGLCSPLLLSATGLLESRFMVVRWAALTMVILVVIALVASFSETVFRLIHERILGRFHNNGIAEKLRIFHDTYRAYQNNTRSLAAFSVLTFAEQLLPILQSWLIALVLGIHVGVLILIMAIPLSLLVSRLPIGIDGFGTYEASFVFLLSLAGISGAKAIAISFR